MFCVIAPEKDVTDAACFLQLWDIRKKAAIQTFQNTYQVLAVTFNDTSDQIISGGIDNDIKVWLFMFIFTTHVSEANLSTNFEIVQGWHLMPTKKKIVT